MQEITAGLCKVRSIGIILARSTLVITKEKVKLLSD